VKNILFNLKFRVLYESEFFATKKYRVCREKGDLGAKMAFFPIQYLLDA
jgi:hypothetical protein